jgi:hypothetical protein
MLASLNTRVQDRASIGPPLPAVSAAGFKWPCAFTAKHRTRPRQTSCAAAVRGQPGSSRMPRDTTNMRSTFVTDTRSAASAPLCADGRRHSAGRRRDRRRRAAGHSEAAGGAGQPCNAIGAPCSLWLASLLSQARHALHAQRGYKVRALARSAQKAAELLGKQPNLEVHAGRQL